MVEIAQWPTLIALFSQCVPLLVFVIAELEDMLFWLGRGGDLGRAELAQFEYFVYDHLKSCRGDDGVGLGGGLGCLEARFG